uniref:Uncharacterized protein n=1 Tax=Ditylenchus dipsaci TaxID=166011 RepID=A0A915D388_9BILA
MASRCLGKIGSRAASRLFSSKQASLWTPSSASLVQRKLIHTSPSVGSNKGPEGAPPQRFISGTGHIVYFLVITAIVLSYPSYLFYNMDSIKTRVPKNLGEGVKEEIERRKELRAQGAMPVLQMTDK